MKAQKQKILITAYDFFPNTGGVATYAKALASHLAELDCEILVVTKERPHKIKEPLPFSIQYISLAKNGFTSFPLFAYQLRKIIKDFEPEKIINTLWMPGGVATALALQSLKRKIDFYIVVHAMEIIESSGDWKKKIRGQFNFLKKWTFKRAKKVFCVSQYTKTLTQELTQCNPDKIEVIHNGVRVEKFDSALPPASFKEKWQKKTPLLFTLARLLPHKGIDTAIQSLPKVLEHHPQLHYLVGGTGPDKERLQSLIKDLGVESSVTLLGHIPDEYLPFYYKLCDLFMLLSRENFPHVEGFGLVILEAAACKTPSLGGMSGGIPDAIVEGKTGWLVDPKDHQVVSEKIISILKEPGALEAMGESAYNYTRLNRTWLQVSQKILQQMEN